MKIIKQINILNSESSLKMNMDPKSSDVHIVTKLLFLKFLVLNF